MEWENQQLNAQNGNIQCAAVRYMTVVQRCSRGWQSSSAELSVRNENEKSLGAPSREMRAALYTLLWRPMSDSEVAVAKNGTLPDSPPAARKGLERSGCHLRDLEDGKCHDAEYLN